jgi:hypothetical protein
MKHITLALMLTSLLCLPACTMLKKISGQTDDTVLPGTRENVLPPDQQMARDPNVVKKASKPCNPKVAICPPADAAQDLAPENDLLPEDASPTDVTQQ